MEKGLKKRWLGILFAVIITITFGLVFNSVQANTITLAFHEVFGTSRVWLGIILTLFTLLVIFGGIHRIAVISGIIVPLMAIAYILLAAFILFTHLGTLPDVIGSIFTNALGFEQFAGGGLGAIVMQGVRRGLFSNEAGMGSAPNAAATAAVSHPVKQGLIQALSVFTDTLIICSCTAFIMLVTPEGTIAGLEGMDLLQASMEYHLGRFGVVFIAVILGLFCFSTFIGILFYARSNVAYLFGDNWISQTAYKILALGMLFVGGLAAYTFVWDLGDVGVGMMTVFNILVILPLSKEALASLREYEKGMEASRQGKTAGEESSES